MTRLEGYAEGFKKNMYQALFYTPSFRIEKFGHKNHLDHI